MPAVTIINSQAISHMFHFYLWDARKPRREGEGRGTAAREQNKRKQKKKKRKEKRTSIDDVAAYIQPTAGFMVGVDDDRNGPGHYDTTKQLLITTGWYITRVSLPAAQ